jgi:hypothetical protein
MLQTQYQLTYKLNDKGIYCILLDKNLTFLTEGK